MNVTGLILAAGFGTRLRPSTHFCPKPMIPVGGVEPLFHALYQMQELGVRDVIVNAHYLSEQIRSALDRWARHFPQLNLHLSVETPEILGTGGAIHKVVKDFPKLFENRALLVLNGDTLAAFDLRELVADEQKSCFAISHVREHLKKYKPLWIDDKEQWVGIGPTPPEEGARAAHYLGVHFLCARDVLKLKQFLPETVVEVDLFNGVYRPLANSGTIFAARVMMPESESCNYQEKLFWFDMTNTEFLLEAQRFVLTHLSSGTWWSRVLQARYPNIKERSPGVWIDAAESFQCDFEQPVVYVENIEGTSSRRFSSLALGPHASMIFEEGNLSFSSGETALKISNSVVLVSRKDPASESPLNIHNEVRVL
jgi:NDP-sugar pyrophosphorylase family protein